MRSYNNQQSFCSMHCLCLSRTHAGVLCTTVLWMTSLIISPSPNNRINSQQTSILVLVLIGNDYLVWMDHRVLWNGSGSSCWYQSAMWNESSRGLVVKGVGAKTIGSWVQCPYRAWFAFEAYTVSFTPICLQMNTDAVGVVPEVD